MLIMLPWGKCETNDTVNFDQKPPTPIGHVELDAEVFVLASRVVRSGQNDGTIRAVLADHAGRCGGGQHPSLADHQLGHLSYIKYEHQLDNDVNSPIFILTNLSHLCL